MTDADHLPLDDELNVLFAAGDRRAATAAHEYIVLDADQRRAVSTGRAAHLLDMDTWGFIGWAGNFGIPCIDIAEAAWAREMEVVEKLLACIPSSSPPVR